MTIPNTIRIATRNSKLALWQAEHVANQLRRYYPHSHITLVPIVTKGDKNLHTPLNHIGGKGLFIKELEIAMQESNADIAVHSMKDVGTQLPDGFTIAAILKRENPLDAFVSNHYAHLDALPYGATIGTCSLRRRMQLAALRPDIRLLDLRGNLQTRLEKLDRGDFDAIILASAGLIRLGLSARIRYHIPAEICLPAIGQGAIGIECPNTAAFLDLLAPLHDAETASCVQAERIINSSLEGSCQVPIAAYARRQCETFYFDAKAGLPDGSHILHRQQQGKLTDAANIAKETAAQLIADGARNLLQQIHNGFYG